MGQANDDDPIFFYHKMPQSSRGKAFDGVVTPSDIIGLGLVVLAGPFFFITTEYSFPSRDYFVNKQKFLRRLDRAKSFACNSSGALVAP